MEAARCNEARGSARPGRAADKAALITLCPVISRDGRSSRRDVCSARQMPGPSIVSPAQPPGPPCATAVDGLTCDVERPDLPRRLVGYAEGRRAWPSRQIPLRRLVRRALRRWPSWQIHRPGASACLPPVAPVGWPQTGSSRWATSAAGSASRGRSARIRAAPRCRPSLRLAMAQFTSVLGPTWPWRLSSLSRSAALQTNVSPSPCRLHARVA